MGFRPEREIVLHDLGSSAVHDRPGILLWRRMKKRETIRRAQTHYRTHFSTERGIDAIEEILVASARRQEARP